MSEPAPLSPKTEGFEPTFRHLDDPDVPWQAVKAQRNADGTTAHVWEKWLAFSPDPQYLTLYARYDPAMVVRRHGHFSPHVVFVLEGEITVGDRPCPAGTHIELPLGAAFGPIVAGPEGAVLFEVMMGDPRSWGDDPGPSRRPSPPRAPSRSPTLPSSSPAGWPTCVPIGPTHLLSPRTPEPRTRELISESAGARH